MLEEIYFANTINRNTSFEIGSELFLCWKSNQKQKL